MWTAREVWRRAEEEGLEMRQRGMWREQQQQKKKTLQQLRGGVVLSLPYSQLLLYESMLHHLHILYLTLQPSKLQLLDSEIDQGESSELALTFDIESKQLEGGLAGVRSRRRRTHKDHLQLQQLQQKQNTILCEIVLARYKLWQIFLPSNLKTLDMTDIKGGSSS